MKKEDAIKYLQQLYPNGGNCWLDEQRLEAIRMAIQALQEEPVNIWHNASEATPTQGSNILMVRKEEEDTDYPPIAGCFHHTNTRLDGRNWGYYNGFCYNEIEPPVKWAYIDDILNLSNVQRTTKNWKEEPVSEELEKAAQEYVTKEGYLAGLHYNSMIRSFKAGAEWYASHNTKLPDNLLLAARKAAIDMCNIDDKHLDEYPYHPIAEQKFIEGAKWQKTNLWKPADGDDLPEIDREVIALLNNGKVVFAHRPDPKGWDAKSIITEKVEHYTPETYGKGGWNQPNVKWWLDVDKLPNVED